MSSVLGNEFVGVTTLSSKQCTIYIYIYIHTVQREKTPWRWCYWTRSSTWLKVTLYFSASLDFVCECSGWPAGRWRRSSCCVFLPESSQETMAPGWRVESQNRLPLMLERWESGWRQGRLSLLHTMWKSLSLKFLMSLGFMQTSPAALSVLGWTKIVLFSSSHSAYCTDTFRKPSIQQSDQNTRLSAFMQ